MNKNYIIFTFLLLATILIAEIPATLSAASLRYQLNENGLYERYAPDADFYSVTDTITRSVKTEQPMTLNELKEQVQEAENFYVNN